MARRVFYSFHYKPDNWRVAKVRNIGAIEDNKPISDNRWEEVVKRGDPAIRSWIDNQMIGRSCVVVLIGSSTADRKWVKYEIRKGWNDRKGLLGIYIHKIEDRLGNQSPKGRNPLEGISIGGGTSLSSVAKAYNPPYSSSVNVYGYIRENLEAWVEDAIRIRNSHS